jgi:hypothetical protein
VASSHWPCCCPCCCRRCLCPCCCRRRPCCHRCRPCCRRRYCRRRRRLRRRRRRRHLRRPSRASPPRPRSTPTHPSPRARSARWPECKSRSPRQSPESRLSHRTTLGGETGARDPSDSEENSSSEYSESPKSSDGGVDSRLRLLFLPMVEMQGEEESKQRRTARDVKKPERQSHYL